MKLSLFIIIALFGVGCEQINIAKFNVIRNEHPVGNCLCQFDIVGNSSPNDFGGRTAENLYFVDSCKNRDVGDTIKFIIK